MENRICPGCGKAVTYARLAGASTTMPFEAVEVFEIDEIGDEERSVLLATPKYQYDVKGYVQHACGGAR